MYVTLEFRKGANLFFTFGCFFPLCAVMSEYSGGGEAPVPLPQESPGLNSVFPLLLCLVQVKMKREAHWSGTG